jgi:hypothetical protein
MAATVMQEECIVRPAGARRFRPRQPGPDNPAAGIRRPVPARARGAEKRDSRMTSTKFVLAGAWALAAVLAAQAPSREVERVRRATAHLAHPDSATAAGFAAPAAHCIADPAAGGMGYHARNAAFLAGPLAIERPAFLVLERRADAALVLVAVEYAVPYSTAPRDSAAPTLLGQRFARADALQLWYLHVWAFRENPTGPFADFNPNVTCRP